MLIYLQMLETAEDRSKFEQLYKRYRNLLFLVANKILENEMDAEDAVHEAFITIAKNFSNIGEIACPKTQAYVVIIVRCRSLDILRKRNRQPHTFYEDEIGGGNVDYDGPIAVASCFAKLGPRYRDALLLKFRHGLSTKEIAAVFRISKDGAEKLIQRARKKLEELCQKEGLL